MRRIGCLLVALLLAAPAAAQHGGHEADQKPAVLNDTAVDEARSRATFEATQKAVALSVKASPREQAYILALAKRYRPEPDADWKDLHLDYSDAMRELVRQYPDDLDAATMFAESLMMLRPWQLWKPDGKPAPGTLELVAVLESVLRRDPRHPGGGMCWHSRASISSGSSVTLSSPVSGCTRRPL
jgi:hypothetical protein